ncbi:hypothetical protein ANAPRD1_00488 [Anaplasma phagocytophilum]|nr:hypothetical protein ANAPRD1_00488 [Anaplasma phagocytophilum]SCV65756.1 hypothetical protein ANAPH2_01367 [Anaplasma phagocytophilum]
MYHGAIVVYLSLIVMRQLLLETGIRGAKRCDVSFLSAQSSVQFASCR